MAKDNTLDRATALRLMTSGGYSLLNEDFKGKMKKGCYADIVILDRDYFNVEEEEIKSIQSVLTVLNGKVVYAREEYGSMATIPLPVIPTWSPVNYFKPAY